MSGLRVLRLPNATDNQNHHILVAEGSYLIPSFIRGLLTECEVFLPHGCLFEV